MTGADIGLIGLGVMGENLALNMESRGYSVAVYNRTPERTGRFLARCGGRAIEAAESLEALTARLRRPRILFLMVRAGEAVDGLLEALSGYLEPGDILVDGGNSHYRDTERRDRWARARGLLFVGCGISGGEEGALRGPSIMPGGPEEARERVEPILLRICAQGPAGEPCCRWIGPGGSGHFVKMVHNGIEYGDMQLICEGYHLLRDYLGLAAKEIAGIFDGYARTELDSYLISITGKILAREDVDGRPLVDKILDTAGQKGTGKWASVQALEEGVPLTMISEAVFARYLSADKELRVRASALYGGKPAPAPAPDFVDDLRQALYAAKIVSYAQGFSLMTEASRRYGWGLEPGRVALIWRGGCIIRSPLLERIHRAFQREPELENLLLSRDFVSEIRPLVPAWRRVVSAAAACGVPVPAMGSALAYFDGFTTENLPANLLQAQRDCFGAHTYERRDAPRGKFFHTVWDTGPEGAPKEQEPQENIPRQEDGIETV